MFKPLYDRIVVEVDPAKKTTESGIYITTSDNPNQVKRGTVRAVGTGRLLQDGTTAPLEVKEGDRVAFTGRSGIEFDMAEDNDHVILRENEILGVIED